MVKHKGHHTRPAPPPGRPNGGAVTECDDADIMSAELSIEANGKSVQVHEDDRHTVAGNLSVEFPTLTMPYGYVRLRHDVTLTRSQAETWRSIAQGLEQQECKLQNGKYVTTVADAIRWTAENAG